MALPHEHKPRLGTMIINHPWGMISVGLLVLFGLWVHGTRTQAHHVRAVFDQAVSIAPGLDVQANGVDIGKVSSVKYEDGQAIVELGIDKDNVWPLHRGTTATIRYGTTVGNGTRRVDIVPGKDTAPTIPEDGVLARTDTQIPTEFDQLFSTFDAATRKQVQLMTQTLDGTLRGRTKALGDGIRAVAPALDETGGVLSDLAIDQAALRSLVHTGDRVTRTLAARDDQIRGLMTVAGQTFDTFARNASNVTASIDRFPGTLRETRTTLARLDTSLDTLQPLMADLRPGAAALRPLAATAGPAILQLRKTVPGALDAVHTLRRASPAVTSFLTKGTPFMRRVAPLFQDLTPMAACLRPYAPDVAGFFSNWASFPQNYDARAHYARVRVVTGLTQLNELPAGTPSTAITKAGFTYAGLRPPGFNEGKPSFLPQCGVGQDVVDPSKDWEDK